MKLVRTNKIKPVKIVLSEKILRYNDKTPGTGSSFIKAIIVINGNKETNNINWSKTLLNLNIQYILISNMRISSSTILLIFYILT